MVNFQSRQSNIVVVNQRAWKEHTYRLTFITIHFTKGKNSGKEGVWNKIICKLCRGRRGRRGRRGGGGGGGRRRGGGGGGRGGRRGGRRRRLGGTKCTSSTCFLFFSCFCFILLSKFFS